jgi:monovalent cation:H+ antiporter-2, CPA2 family
LLFKLLDGAKPWLDAREAWQRGDGTAAAIATSPGVPPTSALTDHVVVAGYGRVGRLIGEALHAQGHSVLVLEEEKECVAMLHQQGVATIVGNAARDDVLAAANLAHARALVVTLPDAFEGGEVVREARLANPRLTIIARADSDASKAHLRQQGADLVVLAESELARGMLERLHAGQSVQTAASGTA